MRCHSAAISSGSAPFSIDLMPWPQNAWLLGISLIVLGVINVVRAFSFGKQRG